MATSKGFESRDSKSEKGEGGKQSGGPTFDVLHLLGMPSAKDIEKNVKSTVDHAVDGLKHLVGQAEKHEQKQTAANTHRDFPRGSLLRASEHHDFQRGSLLNAHTKNHDHPLMGRLTHNETAHQNPSHLSAFLLRRLHQNDNQAQMHAQSDQQPMQFNLQATRFEQQPVQFENQPMSFDQQNQQAEPQGNSWQEAKYNIKHAASEAVLDYIAKPLASMVVGSEYNPNLGADENRLREMHLPFVIPLGKHKERLDKVIHGVATGHAEKFQSQIQHFQGSGPFHSHAQRHSNAVEHNYYQQSQQQLPYGGFQSHMSYYRRSS